MTAGTWASYQGKPCVAVTFRRARGAAATLSSVVIPAAAFPDGFDWQAAGAELSRRPAAEVPDLSPAFADEPQEPAPLAPGLAYEGTLVLAESGARVFAVPGLVVTAVEAVQADDQGGPVLIRLTLADARLFAGVGLLPRWRFNALRADGSPDLSSFLPANFGEVRGYWLSEVAQVCALASWRKPELVRWPQLWGGKRREVIFEPLTPGLAALERLCEIEGAEEPVLHLDGTLGVYLAGEGLLGYAADGEGPNAIPIPPEVILDADGAGDIATEEASFPAEFVAVVGRERVATVALSNWEPVVMIEGRPFLLSEELVRYLTGGDLETDANGRPTGVSGGAYGLEWLRKWILLPNADQGTVEPVDADVLRLFAEQAWRLWRLPGVEKIDGGFYTGDRGKNAQLLPILDRAETRDGRRIRPTVEAHAFESRRKQLDATSQNAALAKIQAKTAIAQAAVKKALIAKLQANPGSNVYGSFGRSFKGLTTSEMYGGLLPPGVDAEQVDRALSQYRELERAKQLGVQPELVAELERSLSERAEAADGLSYEESRAAYEVAKQLAEWERTTANAVGIDGADFRNAFRREFGERAKNLLEELGRKRRLANRQRESDKEAGRPRGDRISFVFQLNLPRRADAGARVESDELGVIRTSALCGHLEDEDVPSPELSRFIPRPPRVLFGAAVRPRIDVPQQFSPNRPTTGGPSAADRAEFALGLLGNLTSDDFIPPALTDEASIFVRYFKRVGKGTIAQVEREQVPLDRCAIVRRDWQELVPLEELGNVKELEVEASKIAIGLAGTPDRVKSRALQLAGAWPVNCDGIVSAVEVVMTNEGGVPCGFETRIATGGAALVEPRPTSRERVQR